MVFPVRNVESNVKSNLAMNNFHFYIKHSMDTIPFCFFALEEGAFVITVDLSSILDKGGVF